MSVTVRNYKVEITPHRSVWTQDNAEIGLFSGVLVWVTNYDDAYTSANSRAGILAANWNGPILNSVVAGRKGNLSSKGGGKVIVEGSSNLYNLLDAQNVSIYNSIITISESIDGGAYEVRKTGLITQNQNQLTSNVIPYQDISKGDVTTITQEIEDSGEFYPVNIGNNDKAKTVTVDADFDIPLVGGRVPVFEVVTVDFELISTRSPYSDDATDQEWQEWGVAMQNLLIDNNVAIVQGTQKRIVDNVSFGSTAGERRIRFELRYGDSADDPIVVSSLADDYILIEPIGTSAHNDFFNGSFNSTALSTFVNSAYDTFPQYIDQALFDNNEVQLSDQDGSGWVHIGEELDGDVVLTNGEVTGGSWLNVNDNKRDTFLEVNTTADVPFMAVEKSGSVVVSDTAPDRLIICGYAETTGFGDGYSFQVKVTMRDAFGNFDISTFNTGGVLLGTRQPLDNSIPIIYGSSPTSDQREPFQWETSDDMGIAGVNMQLVVSGLPDSDIVWKSGVTASIEVRLTNNVTDAEFELKLYDLRIFAKVPFSTDEIYCDWKGRQNYADTDYIKTLPQAYEHAIQLQNYQNRGISIPSNGWGLEYPVVADWSQYYDTSSNYGGLAYSKLDSTETFFQIFSDSDARTDKVKAKLARLLWSIGTTDRQGVEKLYPMIEGLEQVDGAGVQITYKDIVKGSIPQFQDRKYEDIFTAINIGYSYDAGADRNIKSINVSNVDQDRYDPSYVTGVTDDLVAAELWNYGNTLYNVYGVLNEFPKELKDCGWIQDEDQAIEYIRNCYKWQGVYLDGEVPTGKKRYIATFKLPFPFAIENDIDVGSKIQLSIKNRTWDGPIEVFHNGIVISVSDNFGIPEPYMVVTAEMLGGNLSGTDKAIIVKGTDSETHVVKGTDSDTHIVKGTL